MPTQTPAVDMNKKRMNKVTMFHHSMWGRGERRRGLIIERRKQIEIEGYKHEFSDQDANECKVRRCKCNQNFPRLLQEQMIVCVLTTPETRYLK